MACGDISKTKFTLNNGITMPAVGFGTYRIKSRVATMQAVDHALSAGYRLFDTAAVYHNESHLKLAFDTLLPKYNLERDDIFITTKLAPLELGKKAATEEAYNISIDNLGVDYVDLFLVHFPGLHKTSHYSKTNAELRHDTWQALVKLYEDGRVNAIGVSNFTVPHLKEMIQYSHGVIPTVNQVEWHPYYYQTDLLRFCKENEIVLQAYSSFGGASISDNSLLTNKVVTKVARKLEVTNAQVLLAWALQQDVAVIPKSTNPDHIKENICINFVIPPEDMKALNGLQKNVKYAWDPRSIT